MSLLRAIDIVKEFPGVRALDGVSLEIRPGEIHALVGENGAGKSTLIKVLAGVHPFGSYRGAIELDGAHVRFRSIRDSEAAGIGVIHQELALVKHMTVSENIFLGGEPGRFGLVDFNRMHSEAARVVESLGVRMDVRSEVARLGVGEQQLVEIAKAIRKQSRILVLDEPTAALADHEVEILMEILRQLRAKGTAIVYISHRLEEVFSLADRITILRDGKSAGSKPASEWTRASVVGAMVGRELKELFPEPSGAIGAEALRVEGLCVEDPDVPDRMLLEDISFSVREGEILGIAGLMGAGRTELLQTIFGSAPGKWHGRVFLAGRQTTLASPADAIRAGLALVPEDRKGHGLNRIFSVLENLSMAHLKDFCSAGFIGAAREFRRCKETAQELGVRASSLHVAAETLSGGNQQKVVLGKWLISPPKVLLLDEPTRGIDVGAKAEIFRLMRELTRKGMAVVMASSELPEVLGMADRVLVLRRGRTACEFSAAEATPERVMEAAT